MDTGIGFQTVLQQCRAKLVLGMSTSQILENSTTRLILGDDITKRHIEDQSTSVQRNQLLLSHVVRGGLLAYYHFKKVLRDTRHLKLLMDLDNTENGLTENTSDMWPRITEKAFAQSKGLIIQNLDPVGTLDRMCATSDVIDEIRIRDIKEQSTSTERIKLLILEVEKLGVTGYELLKQVLFDTGQDGVYDDLMRAERDAMKELITSNDILEDYIGYRIRKDGVQYESSSRHKSNNKIMLHLKVREVSVEFERRYEAQFGQKMDYHLDTQMLKNKDVYFNVLNTIIEDGIHWGRIVGVVSFAGAIAASYEKHGWGKDTVVNWTASFLKKIELWISCTGGWTSLIDFFDEKRPVSKTDDVDDDDDDDGHRLSKNNRWQPGSVDNTDSVDNDMTDGSESSTTTSTGSTSAALITSSPIKTLATHLIGIAGGFVMGMMLGKRS